MMIDRKLTELLVETDPELAEFVRKDWTSVVQLNKALYGSVERSTPCPGSSQIDMLV